MRKIIEKKSPSIIWKEFFYVTSKEEGFILYCGTIIEDLWEYIIGRVVNQDIRASKEEQSLKFLKSKIKIKKS